MKELIARIEEDFASSPVQGVCVLDFRDWQTLKAAVLAPQIMPPSWLEVEGEVRAAWKIGDGKCPEIDGAKTAYDFIVRR